MTRTLTYKELTFDWVEGAKLLDIGGFIVAIHRLFTDTKFIREIKKEYLREELMNRICDSDFNWLYSDN